MESARQMARRSRFPSPRSEGFPIVVVRSPPNRQNLLICMHVYHENRVHVVEEAAFRTPKEGGGEGDNERLQGI